MSIHQDQISKTTIEVVVHMKEIIMSFVRDEDGLTTVEYAVAGALVTVAVVAAFTALGGAVGTTITALTAAVAGP